MAAKREMTVRALRATLLALPMLGAILWSLWPALMTLLAVVTLDTPHLKLDQLEAQGIVDEVKRTIQFHFLSYKTYIPLEDITLDQGAMGSDDDRLSLLMRKACGRGIVYVWVPFGFRLPFLGHKTLEWCWKPELTVARSTDGA